MEVTMESIPKCQCGCGQDVSVGRGGKVFNRFVHGHRLGRTKHGRTRKGEKRDPTWNAWFTMRQRVRAKGGVIHDEWDQSFDAFHRDVGNRPSKYHRLRVLDPRKPWEPGNVAWIPTKKSVLETSTKPTQSTKQCECGCGTLINPFARFVRGHNKGNYRHGGAGSSRDPLYGSWNAMLSRCTNERDQAYPRYGGRGITVCERWFSFVNFIEDMGRPEKGMSLDRIDNDGPYSPENCRWATQEEQALNRRSTRWIEAFGRRQSLSQWAKESGIGAATIAFRLKKGMSPEVAIGSKGNLSHRMISAFGKRQNLAAWIRETGLAETTITNRLKKGMSPEEALASPKEPIKLTAFGKTLTFSQWSKETGIRVKTIRNRIKRGLSLEEALTAPVRGRK